MDTNGKKNEDHGIQSITSQEIDEEKRKQRYILFSGLQKSLWAVSAAVKLKDACPLEGKLWQN